MRIANRWQKAALLLAGLVVVLACRTATGSSVIVSRTGQGTAAVNFSVTCDADQAVGRFSVNDTPANVQFDAVTGNLVILGCATDSPSYTPTPRFTGSYSPVPVTRGAGGTFTLDVVDAGPRGPSREDFFSLTISGGVFDGYHIEGFWISGGYSLDATPSPVVPEWSPLWLFGSGALLLWGFSRLSRHRR